MLRQRFPDRNRNGRLRQAHIGKAVANLVSTADGRTALDSCRRLTHRRASLAFEAPIARPWISLPDLRATRSSYLRASSPWVQHG